MKKQNPITVTIRKREYQIATLPQAMQALQRLADASKAADRQTAGVKQVIEQAMSGHVSPQVAFATFVQFATARGIVVPTRPSTAWTEFAKKVSSAKTRDDKKG